MEKKERLTAFHREAIADAAEELFEKKGIEATSVDEIAAQAEYSKSTLYVYYPSKEEIVQAITLRAMQMLKERILTALLEEQSFAGSFLAVCNSLVALMERRPLYFDRVLAKIPLPGEGVSQAAQLIYEVGEEINDKLSELLRRGMESGEADGTLPQKLTVFSLWGSITGIVRLAKEKEGYLRLTFQMSPREFCEAAFQTLLRSVRRK